MDSDCTYYLDCPGVAVTPSLKSDFFNAQSYLDEKPEDIYLNVSMTNPDLKDPEQMVRDFDLLVHEFPGVFAMAGEVNLVKQALFENGRTGVDGTEIDGWAPFMAKLEENGFPINFHSDLGNDADPTKYLPLMEKTLRLYPNNKIIWAHLGGLSKELRDIDPDEHIAILERLFKQYPNLYIDLSWRVLDDQVFSDPDKRAAYIAFINRWPDRFLPGTDFVASDNKSESVYRDEFLATSDIYQDLGDEAFRKIALGQNFFDLYHLDYKAPGIYHDDSIGSQ
ncbi:amidohydrolase family protein [Roseibium sp. RKSG952]|uniref:amidohydrolase family protein n=1 Tax=Roseibium sp. RKSG952 TaxID=2529384 RepID=UPI0018AD2A78